MTLPQSLINPPDKIIYQVGLNILKYRQIEGVAKNLVVFSDYTFGSSSSPNKESRLWPIISNVNTTKMTMGGLTSLLGDVQIMDEDEDIEDSNEIKISIKMSHRVINRHKIEALFKKVVAARNELIHHFDCFLNPSHQNEESNSKVLERLQSEYEDAEYLLAQLQQELSFKLDFIMESLKFHSEAMTINQLADIFDNAYQECKRNDGWAAWQQVISYVYKTSDSKASIEKLKEKTSRKQTKSALQLYFPNWQFIDEPTKNGARVLVKIDNTAVNLVNNFPKIIISD
ncbi:MULTISPECIES: hypothetical protein [unclassified Psychrobacter]|uniref:hypothetical protein n=1 Tax=unclassified Psychrobacter TaxID=196806 RepID=UPI0025F0EF35|nr:MULTISPECIES: hypothetical protein [unclassified Psychrobacter]